MAKVWGFGPAGEGVMDYDGVSGVFIPCRIRQGILEGQARGFHFFDVFWDWVVLADTSGVMECSSNAPGEYLARLFQASTVFM